VPIIGRIGILALIDACCFHVAADVHYLLPASALFPFLVVCVLGLSFRQPGRALTRQLDLSRRKEGSETIPSTASRKQPIPHDATAIAKAAI